MTRQVVIADGDAERARRLLEACRSRGIDCEVAAHGAQALEQALAAPPAVIVARADLPLVDAPRLAEILRANPRTRPARFVFLGDERDPAAPGGVGDLWMAPAPDPTDVAASLEELLERCERAARVGSEPGRGTTDGELGQLPLVELLQVLHVNRKSGVLTLRGRDAEGQVRAGEVAVRDGEIVSARADAAEGEKALYRLLTWRHGHFHLEPDLPGEDAVPPRILTPTRSLLAEGARQLAEWERWAGQLPPPDAQVRLCVKSAELPHMVHPLTQEVLLLLELYARVGDVVDRCSFPDYQVLRTLHTLEKREIIRLGAPRSPGPRGRSSGGLFDEAQLRRLRGWIRRGAAVDGPCRDAKLLLAASDGAATPDFANLLRRVPGVRLAPGVAEEGVPPDALRELGRIALDDHHGIELLHVPVDERFAPLWRLAGHGALGTLFLLGGRVGEDALRVQAVSETLHELPQARIFHVVLLGKGERISPDELRENLSLIDEASLFLLPLESPKEPVALLRSLFARVVP